MAGPHLLCWTNKKSVWCAKSVRRMHVRRGGRTLIKRNAPHAHKKTRCQKFYDLFTRRLLKKGKCPAPTTHNSRCEQQAAQRGKRERDSSSAQENEIKKNSMFRLFWRRDSHSVFHASLLIWKSAKIKLLERIHYFLARVLLLFSRGSAIFLHALSAKKKFLLPLCGSKSSIGIMRTWCLPICLQPAVDSDSARAPQE